MIHPEGYKKPWKRLRHFDITFWLGCKLSTIIITIRKRVPYLVRNYLYITHKIRVLVSSVERALLLYLPANSHHEYFSFRECLPPIQRRLEQVIFHFTLIVAGRFGGVCCCGVSRGGKEQKRSHLQRIRPDHR